MANFSISLGQLVSVLGASSSAVQSDVQVCHVATDSRQLPPSPFVFFALAGPNFDGNRFATQALERGAAAVVVTDPGIVAKTAPHIVVSDGLRALQALAGWWRQLCRARVVAITGSNGKTAVKEMLNAILAPRRFTYRSPGSFNSQLGVALALLRMPADADVALIECGISRAGEMRALEAMVRPELGILTNIGTAHLAGFGSVERLAREKWVLFDRAQHVVAHTSACDTIEPVDPEFVSWVGPGQHSEVRAEVLQLGPRGLSMRLVAGVHSADAVLNSVAAHDAENAVCAVAAACQLGMDLEDAAAGLSAYQSAPMRIEVHTTPSGITLINDSYSADPPSMRSALQTLQRLSRGRRKVAVLGTMSELGLASDAAHADVGRVAAEIGVDLLLSVGAGAPAQTLAQSARRHGVPDVRQVLDAAACATELETSLQPGDIVLVKASRPLRLERTSERLLESLSPSRVYIDLGVIAENVRLVRRWVGASTKVIGVVKSFGYGSDGIRVSENLELHGIDYLMVAYPDEGVQLRRGGIQTPILVANIVPDEVDKVVRHRLSAVVSTARLLDQLIEAGQFAARPLPVHLKLDSGMGRFGATHAELLALAERAASSSVVRIEGVMSHLAAADDPEHDEHTQLQISRFSALLADLAELGIRPDFVHLANTAGLLRFPEAHFSAVRLGLGLYGAMEATPLPEGAPRLAPALEFRSRLVSIRRIAEGETVGYGRTWRAPSDRPIGVVGLGYNDGLPRSLSNRGYLWIHGQRVPIVGRICMDVTMIDLSDVPDAAVGDDVVIFGSGEQGQPTVPEVAAWAETISYEILCRISPRVRRIVRLPS